MSDVGVLRDALAALEVAVVGVASAEDLRSARFVVKALCEELEGLDLKPLAWDQVYGPASLEGDELVIWEGLL